MPYTSSVIDRPTGVALLRALLDAAQTRADPSALLHEDVRLHRLDGSALAGRAAVVKAIVAREAGAGLSVAREHEASIDVALSLDDLPGPRLLFSMRAEMSEGRLREIWMEALATR